MLKYKFKSAYLIPSILDIDFGKAAVINAAKNILGRRT